MNILVTGGAGYIGSHACKALSKSGYLPVTYDNLVSGHPWAVQWGPLEIGDISDHGRLTEVIRKYRPVAVMHFAAHAYVGESVLIPSKYYRNNVIGSLTLFDVMRENNIDKLVFSSTCATYGTPEKSPITEDNPLNPINPYGASKMMIERILKDYENAYAFHSISLRYFNAAGADLDGEIGEAHDPETHLIPLVLEAALGMRPVITIYGDDYDTPDGTCIRDYIHVSDIADAHVLALRALEYGSRTAAYNLGNGQGFSVKEVIKMAETITSKTIASAVTSRRIGDPARLIGDPSKAKVDLLWNAKHSNLEEILSSAWNWHTGRKNATN
jgi:UDP-arabinose 4-epimerase